MSRSNEFERRIELSFDLIRKKYGTWFDFLNPPVVMTGYKGKTPAFVMAGSSMFDVIGWESVRSVKHPKTIGIELKNSSVFRTAMPLLKPKQKGSGIKYHQIQALAALHNDGHIAGFMWNNAGQIGIVRGEKLSEAFINFCVSIEAEKLGAKPDKGTRSISWEATTRVEGVELDSWYSERFYRDED